MGAELRSCSNMEFLLQAPEDMCSQHLHLAFPDFLTLRNAIQALSRVKTVEYLSGVGGLV
jgi:hypothetical protein